MEAYRVCPGDATADLLEALRRHIRLLEQRLHDAEQRLNDAEQRFTDAQSLVEELDCANDRQKHELECRQQRALALGDNPRPDVVMQILKHVLRSWPKTCWLALIDHIRRFLSETCP